PEQVQLSDNLECHVVVAGMMMDYKIRKTRKGEAAKITLENNNDTIDVMLWNDAWDQWKDELKGAVGKCVMLNGKIQYDGYNKKNAVYSSGTIVNVF
ncbi:MAG TPA: OB-fold nucleic acid binding domain-containing protein, partial [Candidatus Woesebacteria bacterium]|nr:OB-fold nucleic acid binding domain-containing protein [Candidatus Woesebacteria bacterium]